MVKYLADNSYRSTDFIHFKQSFYISTLQQKRSRTNKFNTLRKKKRRDSIKKNLLQLSFQVSKLPSFAILLRKIIFSICL